MSITVQENQGKAAVKRATQEAEQTRTLAKARSDRADHRRGRSGEGRGARRRRGRADHQTVLTTAETIEKQAAASGGAQYQLTRQAIERIA